MAVPGHDSRDFAFARHFDLPIVQVVVKDGEEETNPAMSEWTITCTGCPYLMVFGGV